MCVSGIILAVSLPVFDFATNSIAQRIAGADPAVCLSRFVDYPPSKGKLGFPCCLWEKPFPANEKFRWRMEIQKAMDELCPRYKLEVFDFLRLKIGIEE